MLNFKNLFLLICSYLIVFEAIALEYVWIGGGDGVSLYKEKNWEDNGQNPDKIDPGVPITYHLLVNSGTVGGGGFNGNLLLGGNRFTITGGQVVGQNNSGIQSFELLGEDKSQMIISGGTLRCFFLYDIIMSVSANAFIELLGTSDVLEGSTVNIDEAFTGSIILKNINIETVRENYLSKFTVGGIPAEEGKNLFLSIKLNGTQLSLHEIEDEKPISNKDYSDSPRPNNGPNIIYILLDDMGYGDLGHFWQNQRAGDQKMRSPVLDKLAEEGVMLKQHYCAAPVCAPSRASLLEGLHQGHASVRNNQFDKELKAGLGMPAMLQKAGYRTMHVGKYGLAGGRNTELEGHPLKRGFDQYFGYLFHNQGHIHYPQDGTTSKEAYFTDGSTPILEGTMLTYTTDVFTAKSKQWIIDHRNARSEQPFFLYLAYDVPHSALDVPTVEYPEGRGVNGGVQWTSKHSETPWVNTAKGTRNAYIHPDYENTGWPAAEKKFATMMRRVDNACEDLVQTLKDLGIDENTMLVFSSDNGPHEEGGRTVPFFQSYANMNGIKRDMWEGGIKMATIARYPGTIPENTEHTTPSGQWDWMATFAELAGVSQPVYTDGVSLMPSLKQEEGQQTKGYLYHEYYQNGSTPNYSDFLADKQGRKRNQMQVIRIGNYKGVRYNVMSADDDFEIYDVINNPQESENLAAAMPALQQQMKEKVLQVRKANDSAERPYDSTPIPSVNVAGVAAGIQKQIYEGEQLWVPLFENYTCTDSAMVVEIDADSQGRDSLFGLFYTGYLKVETSGSYNFYLESSAPSHVMLHNIHLLDNDFTFTDKEISTGLNLEAGFHPLRFYYQQNKNVIPELKVSVSGPSLTKQAIPQSMLYYVPNGNVGIEETELAESITLFPQPVTDVLNLNVALNNSAEFNFSVYDSYGRKVKVLSENSLFNGGDASIRFSVRELSTGVYILGIEDLGSGELNYRKFVKR